jgi:hypothetical protein
MRLLLMMTMGVLGATFTAAAGPLDPPVPDGVVFIHTLQAAAWMAPVEAAGTTPTLQRVARALQARPPADPGRRGRLGLAFDIPAVGATPAVDVSEAFTVGAPTPARPGPPTHDEWLMHLTPAAFRSTAPYRSLRPGIGW